MRITTEEVGPELWPEVERLFGVRGACGGCWCQAWRVAKGESWKALQGAPAKARLKKGLATGAMRGVLALVEGRAVGWCTFGPRPTFPRLERARTLRCDDAERVVSIPCFFVARGGRGRGVATALLARVLRILKSEGAEIAEAYPSKPGPDGRYIDTFAWTGTRSLFAKAGFTVAGNPEGGRQRVRKTLRTKGAKGTRPPRSSPRSSKR
jgi:GNAT superfamily N-acetyltransferase